MIKDICEKPQVIINERLTMSPTHRKKIRNDAGFHHYYSTLCWNF
jgi:hypothetical protein